MKPEASDTGLVVAVGTFDGLHLGHRALLGEVRRTASRTGLTPGVVTFSSHPLATLRPERVPALLATPALKRRLLDSEGIGRVVTLDFTPALAAMTAREFVEMLRRDYGVRHIVLGFNTSMGSDRVSAIEAFEAIAAETGVGVSRAPEFTLPRHDGPVCSSAVRRLVSEGDVSSASLLLGRPYRLSGSVVHGRALGRQLGYPTANIEPSPAGQAIPAPGVYACRATVDGGAHTYGAMVNIGSRPTVDSDGHVTIEAHLFDLDADLYGRTIDLDFIARLRDEQRFPSLDALRTRLAADASAARLALAPIKRGTESRDAAPRRI